MDAFLAAARGGDFEGLMRMLDPDVVLRGDGGPNAPRPFAELQLIGAEAVARGAAGFRGAADQVEPVIVDGAPGMLLRFAARSIVAAFTVANGRIVAIDIVADPDKLRGAASRLITTTEGDTALGAVFGAVCVLSLVPSSRPEPTGAGRRRP